MEPGAPPPADRLSNSSSSDDWSSDEESALARRDSHSHTNISSKKASKKLSKMKKYLHQDNAQMEDQQKVEDAETGGEVEEEGQEELDEPEKERMLRLLRTFSSPIDPSSISSTRIESLTSLPSGLMDAHSIHNRSCNCSRAPSRVHSCANSNSNIHSCLNSTHAINGVGPSHMAR